MENIEYWQYWRTLIFMSNINIKAIKIFIFTFFSNESVKLLHIMGGELSLTASKVAHNNNDAKFHRKAKYAQIHEYTFNTFSTCTPLKVLWPWTSLNKLKEQFNSRSGGTGAESYEYSKYPILPRAGWVKTLWNMSGGSEKNGDVAAGGVGAWRGGGGCCHQSEGGSILLCCGGGWYLVFIAICHYPCSRLSFQLPSVVQDTICQSVSVCNHRYIM